MTDLNHDHPSQALATFAAGLRFDDIPAAVLRRTEDLFLDWIGSVLAGKRARPVEAIAALGLDRWDSEQRAAER